MVTLYNTIVVMVTLYNTIVVMVTLYNTIVVMVTLYNTIVVMATSLLLFASTDVHGSCEGLFIPESHRTL